MGLLGGKPDVYQLKQQKDMVGLRKALAYKSDSVIRSQAAFALGELLWKQSDFTFLAPLLEALHDHEAGVRRNAASALKYLVCDQTIAALIQALEDPSHDVARAAIKTLGEIGDPRAIQPLIQSIPAADQGYQSLETMVEIAKSLRRFKDVEAWEGYFRILELLPKEDPEIRKRYYGHLVDDQDLASVGIELLAKLSKSSNAALRLEAVLTAGYCMYGREGAALLLLESLTDESEKVRSAAQDGLLNPRTFGRKDLKLMAQCNNEGIRSYAEQELKWIEEDETGGLQNQPPPKPVYFRNFKDALSGGDPAKIGIALALVESRAGDIDVEILEFVVDLFQVAAQKTCYGSTQPNFEKWTNLLRRSEACLEKCAQFPGAETVLTEAVSKMSSRTYNAQIDDSAFEIADSRATNKTTALLKRLLMTKGNA